MNLKTRYKATNIKTGFVTFSFLIIGILIVLFFTDYIPWKAARYATLGLAVLVYLYYYIRRFMYIQYIDEGDKVVLRYFIIIPSTLDHHAIEIPKKSLYKYEIKERFFSLRKELVLIQKTRNGLAKYPPVSISILNKEQLTELTQSLDRIIAANR